VIKSIQWGTKSIHKMEHTLRDLIVNREIFVVVTITLEKHKIHRHSSVESKNCVKYLF